MKYLLFVADKDIWLKKKDISYEEFKDIEATPQGIFQPEMIYELGKDIGYKERVDKYLSSVFMDMRIDAAMNEEFEFKLADVKILEELATIYQEKAIEHLESVRKSHDIGEALKEIEWDIADFGCIERRPEGKWLLCNSWSYKYAFFNLLYIMSKIDPDKQVLLWVGI